MKKKCVAAVLAVLCILSLSACSAGDLSNDKSSALSEPTPNLPKIDSSGFLLGIAPVTITRSQATVDKSVILYPSIVKDGAKLLNDTIYTSIVACLKYVNSPIYTHYRIKYNKNNIVSLLVSYRLTSNDELVYLLPLNFYVDSAQPVAIKDCLNADNDLWRKELSEMIERKAKDDGITLLSNIPQIPDGQMFYFEDAGITLVYRPYEISTYSPAAPEFFFERDTLTAYIAEGSPLFKEVSVE